MSGDAVVAGARRGRGGDRRGGRRHRPPAALVARVFEVAGEVAGVTSLFETV